MTAVRSFLYILLIALANNFDNIGVRIAYSIRGIKIATLINVWISVITFIISYFAAFSGSAISGVVSKRLSSFIAMLLLAAIGLWMILEPRIKERRNRAAKQDEQDDKSICGVLVRPENADMDNSRHIDFKEATILGIALSINNVGGGVSAGIIGLNPFWVGLLSAVLSFVALWAGNYVAEFFTRWHIADKATVIAGILLIVIGIEQIM